MEEAIDIVEAEEIYDGDIEKDFDFFAMSNIDNNEENEGDDEPSFDEHELYARQRSRGKMSYEHSLLHIHKWRLLRVTTGRCLGRSLAQEI